MKKSEDRKQGAGEGGFTLIETIITLVVLSIAAVGVLSVFTVGIKGSANPLLVNQAIALAQEKMETIVGDRENAPPTGTRGFAFIIPGNYPAESAGTLGFPGFSRTTTIYCVNKGTPNTNNFATPPCASNYARVTVTVTNAAFGNISVDTLLTNY